MNDQPHADDSSEEQPEEPNKADPWAELAESMGLQPTAPPKWTDPGAPDGAPSDVAPSDVGGPEKQTEKPSGKQQPVKNRPVSDWNQLAGDLGLDVPPPADSKPTTESPKAEDEIGWEESEDAPAIAASHPVGTPSESAARGVCDSDSSVSDSLDAIGPAEAEGADSESEPEGSALLFFEPDDEADVDRADITGADITGADITGADFSGADFSEASPSGADPVEINSDSDDLTDEIGSSQADFLAEIDLDNLSLDDLLPDEPGDRLVAREEAPTEERSASDAEVDTGPEPSADVDSGPQKTRSKRRRRRRRGSGSKESTGDGRTSTADKADRELTGDEPAAESTEESGAAESDVPQTEGGEEAAKPRRRRRRRRGAKPESGEVEPKAEKVGSEARGAEDETTTPSTGETSDATESSDSTPRAKHRKIPTWDEAIGVLVDTNLESRNKPSSSRGSSRGQRRRGRGSGKRS